MRASSGSSTTKAGILTPAPPAEGANRPRWLVNDVAFILCLRAHPGWSGNWHQMAILVQVHAQPDSQWFARPDQGQAGDAVRGQQDGAPVMDQRSRSVPGCGQPPAVAAAPNRLTRRFVGVGECSGESVLKRHLVSEMVFGEERKPSTDRWRRVTGNSLTRTSGFAGRGSGSR